MGAPGRAARAFDDLAAIAREQLARERSIGHHATSWLVCDTTPLTTRFYSEVMFSAVDAALERMADRRYDAIALCAPDFAFVQDGTRRGEAFRCEQHARYEQELHRRRWPYLLATGSVTARVHAARAALDALAPARSA